MSLIVKIIEKCHRCQGGVKHSSGAIDTEKP